jgi:hypothetical protein
MFHPAYKLTLLLLAISLLLVAIIGAAAYDHAYFDSVRALFTPSADCPPPCLFGIRPGVTTVDDAARILQTHPWHSDASVVDWQMVSTSIDWNWNGLETASVTAWENDIRVIEPRVYSVSFTMDIPFGALWLALGRPELGAFDHTFHQAYYTDRGFYVRTPSACYGYWGEPVTIIIHVWEPAFLDYGMMRSRICHRGIG